MFDDTKKTILKYATFFIVLAGLSLNAKAEAASPRKDIKAGNQHYEKGDYAQALDEYQEALKKAPESDIVNFNSGTAAYKEKEYEQAADYFQKVFLSEDEQLKENAHYNLGNVLYQQGITQEDENIDAAVESLKSALSQYERALSMDKEDKDAQHNSDYVKKELIRLQQEQQQQENNQKSQENQQDQQQEQQQKQQGQEGEGQQNQQRQQQSSQEEQEGQDGEKSQSKQEEKKEGSRQQQEEQEQTGQQGEAQDEQEKSGQGRGQEGQEDYNKQQESGGQPQDAQELTPKEAQMLLESYQRGEEPRGLLNVHPRAKDSSPVFKDW